jgi:hypothetical protein
VDSPCGFGQLAIELAGDGDNSGVNFRSAGLFEYSGAFVQRSPRGLDVIDQTDIFAGERMSSSDGEGACDVFRPLRGASIAGLLSGISDADKVSDDSNALLF